MNLSRTKGTHFHDRYPCDSSCPLLASVGLHSRMSQISRHIWVQATVSGYRLMSPQGTYHTVIFLSPSLAGQWSRGPRPVAFLSSVPKCHMHAGRCQANQALLSINQKSVANVLLLLPSSTKNIRVKCSSKKCST